MKVSRSVFLRIGGAVLAHVSLGSSVLARTNARVLLRDANVEAFQSVLNTTFTLQSPAGACVALALESVINRDVDPHFEQFSLIFRSQAHATVPQGLYGLHHVELGTIDVFIVPVDRPTDSHSVYEACFSTPRAARAGDV